MTDLNLKPAAAVFHSTKALYCWCLHQRSICNTYSQSLFTFCSTLFSDRLLQYSRYLMSAKLKAKLVSKVLKLAAAQNCCNLKWTRKLHHVINRIISMYLLCQRKTNRVSKRLSNHSAAGGEARFYTGKRQFLTVLFLVSMQQRSASSSHLKGLIPLGIHTHNTGIK